MEGHLNILHRKLNLLSSWLQLKFPDDPTFPRSLKQECRESEFEVKTEEATSEIPESSNGSRWIKLVDLQSILDSPEPEVGNERGTESPPSLTAQNLSNLHAFGAQQYQTKPCVVNLKRLKSNVSRNPNRDIGGHDSSGEGDVNSTNSECHALDTDYEPPESDDSERNNTRRRVLPLRIHSDAGNEHVPNPYTCTICTMNFTKPNKLLLHKYKVHRARAPRAQKNEKGRKKRRGSSIHRCPECQKPFSFVTWLKKHIEKFHPVVTLQNENGELVNTVRNTRKAFVDPSLPCRFCGKLFKTSMFMRSHLRNKHREEATPEEMAPLSLSLTCQRPGCDKIKRFKNMNTYNWHLKGSHLEEYQDKVRSGEIREDEVTPEDYSELDKRVSCPECHQLLKPLSMRAHLRYKHNQCEQRFLCPQCGVRTKTKARLDSHMETHFEERKYKCGLCPFAAKQQSGLQGHMSKIHNPKEKVQCPLCGYLFTRAENLRKHISRIHENQRPFPCNLCDKAFKESSNLKYHLKTHENPNGRKRGLNKEREPRHRAPNKSLQKKPEVSK